MAGTGEAEAPGDAAVAFRATAPETVISAEMGLCPQIEGRIQGRTARLAGAAVYEPTPRRDESIPAAGRLRGATATTADVFALKDSSNPGANVRPDIGFVPGPKRDEHIGAFSIAPPTAGTREFAHAAIGFRWQPQERQQSAAQGDAGLTAPDAAFRTFSRNTAVDWLLLRPCVLRRQGF